MFKFFSWLTFFFFYFATVQSSTHGARVSGVIHESQGVALSRFLNQLSYWLKEKSVPSSVANNSHHTSLSWPSPLSSIRCIAPHWVKYSPVVPHLSRFLFLLPPACCVFFWRIRFSLAFSQPTLPLCLLLCFSLFFPCSLIVCYTRLVSLQSAGLMSGGSGSWWWPPRRWASLPRWVSMVMMLCDRRGL